MDCRKVTEVMIMQEVIQLTGEESACFHQHIENCPDCAAELEEWKRLHGMLDRLPCLEPSPEFTERVMDRIDHNRYSKALPEACRNHGGELLVILGVLLTIQTMSLDTLQWLIRLMADRMQENQGAGVLVLLYDSVIVRIAGYLLVPGRMFFQLLTHMNQVSPVWYAVGMINLLLLLVLFHLTIQRMVTKNREELS